MYNTQFKIRHHNTGCNPPQKSRFKGTERIELLLEGVSISDISLDIITAAASCSSLRFE